MSHSESYLNIEAIKQKEGIGKSEDDGVERERVMMESVRGLYIGIVIHLYTPSPPL